MKQTKCLPLKLYRRKLVTTFSVSYNLQITKVRPKGFAISEKVKDRSENTKKRHSAIHANKIGNKKSMESSLQSLKWLKTTIRVHVTQNIQEDKNLYDRN